MGGLLLTLLGGGIMGSGASPCRAAADASSSARLRRFRSFLLLLCMHENRQQQARRMQTSAIKIQTHIGSGAGSADFTTAGTGVDTGARVRTTG